MTSILSAILQAEGEGVHVAHLRDALARVAPSDEIVALFEAHSRNPFGPFDDSKSRLAWSFYGDLCRSYWRANSSDWHGDIVFSKEHFLEGNFREDLVAAFVEQAMKSPMVPFRVEDSAPGYYFNASSVVPLVEQYNKIFLFRALTPAALGALHDCLEPIAPIVTNCLGSGWRIVQTRFWETRPGGEGVGTNSWHTDGFPLEALKILSFFSEVDEIRGTTQFKKVDGTIHVFRGRAGKWILFRNSVLSHAGLPPRSGNPNRLTVEITLAPSLVTDTAPVFAGVNGHYPYVPWQRLVTDPTRTEQQARLRYG